MAVLLKGAAVTAALNEKMKAQVAELAQKGITPPWPYSGRGEA